MFSHFPWGLCHAQFFICWIFRLADSAADKTEVDLQLVRESGNDMQHIAVQIMAGKRV